MQYLQKLWIKITLSLYIQVATHQCNLCDKDKITWFSLQIKFLCLSNYYCPIFPKSHFCLDLQVNVAHVFITNHYLNKATKLVMLGCVYREKLHVFVAFLSRAVLDGKISKRCEVCALWTSISKVNIETHSFVIILVSK